jgi:formate hydrogenlyase subunit 3/multisubunit Na+/H+ antiporter MnhD subunit
MTWLDALRANAGEVAVLTLLAGAALAAVSPGRVAVAIGLAASAAVAALSADAVWRAQPDNALAVLLGAIAALGVLGLIATLGADAHARRHALAVAGALLAGAGLSLAATTPDAAFAVLGLWLAGLVGIGLIALRAGEGGVDDASHWLGFLALCCGLALLGVALQALAGASWGRLAGLGWALHLLGLLGLAGLAPFNGLQVRLAGHGGPGALLAAVVAPAIALGLALRELAPAPAALAGPAIGSLALVAAAFAAVQMMLAADLRRALAGLIAAQASVCLAGAAVAIATGARAGVEAAGLALMALALGGLAGFCAVDALSPGRTADAASVRGRASQAPLAAVALAVALIGFMGAPLTFAFLGRWLTLGAALQHGWALGAVAVIGSALAAAVLGARWLALVFGRIETRDGQPPRAWGAALAATAAAGLCVAFGLAADWPLGLADMAFAALIRGAAP